MLNFSSKAVFCSQLMPALWIVLLQPSLGGLDDFFASDVLGPPDEPELAFAMDLASGKGTDPGVSRKARSGHSRSRPSHLTNSQPFLCKFVKFAHLTNWQQHTLQVRTSPPKQFSSVDGPIHFMAHGPAVEANRAQPPLAAEETVVLQKKPVRPAAQRSATCSVSTLRRTGIACAALESISGIAGGASRPTRNRGLLEVRSHLASR